MSDPKLPKGYRCKKCDHFKAFSSWVYAHWHEEILSMCEKCGTRHVIIAGEVTVKEGGGK